MLFTSTLPLRVRMAKSRRPKERPWEFFNVRSFGMKEGGQNFRMWALGTITCLCITAYEGVHFFLRIVARGDTCPACEVVREQRQMRAKLAEQQTGL